MTTETTQTGGAPFKCGTESLSLVEKLRSAAYALPSDGDWLEIEGDSIPNNQCAQAADELERLAAHIAALDVELERWADAARVMHGADDSYGAGFYQQAEWIAAYESLRRMAGMGKQP